MCVAVPGKVISINKNTAVLDFLGAQKEVSIQLLDDVNLGDYLLVHAGCAIQKVDLQEAEEVVKLFEELRDAIADK